VDHRKRARQTRHTSAVKVLSWWTSRNWKWPRYSATSGITNCMLEPTVQSPSCWRSQGNISLAPRGSRIPMSSVSFCMPTRGRWSLLTTKSRWLFDATRVRVPPDDRVGTISRTLKEIRDQKQDCFYTKWKTV